jgi:hypothetical protein
MEREDERPITDATWAAAARVEALVPGLDERRRRYERARDERAVFAFAYVLMTRALAEALRERRIVFEDPAWIAELAVRFARRYLDAMDAIDRRSEGDPTAAVPRAWAEVHAATRGGQSYVLEDLMFGMMAHISHDLPHTLMDVEFQGAETRLADFHRMNDVIGLCIGSVQDGVAERYERFLVFLDEWVGNFDELATNYGIRVARGLAWYNACRLASETTAEEAARSVRDSTGSYIRFVRKPPGFWPSLFVRVLRFLIPRRRVWPE